MSGLPKGWIWTITGDVCESVRDGTHDTPKYVEKGVPLITSKNLRNGYIEFSNARNISKEDHEEISKRSGVENGDIVFAMIGTLGNPVVINSDRQFSIKNVGLFKKNELVINSNYLRFWLDSYIFWDIIKSKDFIKGSTQKFISLHHLRNIPLPLPPLNEQRRIVAKLDRLFARSRSAREELERIPKLCDRYKQAILAAACSGRLTADWREQNPHIENASELFKTIQERRKEGYEKDCIAAKAQGRRKPKALDDSGFEEFELQISEDFNSPESWVTCNCRMLADFITDGEHATPERTEEGVLLLSARNIQNGFLSLEKVDYIPEYEYERIIQRCHPQKNDILISCSGSVGRICRVPEGLKFTMVRSVALLKLQYNLDLSLYLELFFQAEITQNQINKLQKSTAQANLFIGQIGKITILLPPSAEQKEIVQRVEKLFKAIDLMTQEYQKASKLLDRLDQATLAKAFRGELVPQDPNDEPAAALLERILAERQNQTPAKRGSTKKAR